MLKLVLDRGTSKRFSRLTLNKLQHQEGMFQLSSTLKPHQWQQECVSKWVEGDIDDKPSYVTKYLYEEESTYRDLRDALSLQLASAFNRGKPSDKDYVVARELLPMIGDPKGMATAKWEALQYLISMKQQAETAGWRAGDREEFLSRIVSFDRGRPSVDFSEAQQFFRGFVPVTDQTGTKDPGQLRADPELKGNE